MNRITPSAASQQINEVERALGVSLLDRSTRPLSLTAEGSLYNDMCRDILRRRGEFLAALDQLKAEVEGTVRVAAIYSVGLSEMSDLEAEFHRRLPLAHLEVEYLRPEKIYEAVAADRVDVGLVSYPEPTREIAVVPWRSEQMVLATHPTHPLATRDQIYPDDLNGVDFVTFDDDLPIGRDISRYLRVHGVEVFPDSGETGGVVEELAGADQGEERGGTGQGVGLIRSDLRRSTERPIARECVPFGDKPTAW